MMKASDKQIRAIESICRNHGLDTAEMVARFAGCRLDELSAAQASRVIDALKGRGQWVKVEPGLMRNATKRAADEHCTVHLIAWKAYEVRSQHATTHAVEFQLRDTGWWARCDCQGSINDKHCYHVAAAWPVFVGHRFQRDEAARRRSESEVARRERAQEYRTRLNDWTRAAEISAAL